MSQLEQHSHGLLDSRLIFLYFITKHNSDFFSLQTMNFKYVERKYRKYTRRVLRRVWYESLWKQHINTPKISFLFILLLLPAPLYKNRELLRFKGKLIWSYATQRNIELREIVAVCWWHKHLDKCRLALESSVSFEPRFRPTSERK